MMSRPIILEHRLRHIERPFGWLPLALLRNGHFAALSAEAKILYCVLCIVSDRRGISYYGDSRLQQITGLTPQDLHNARDELVQHDLIAVDQSIRGPPTVQVLSLPSKCRDRAQSRPGKSPPAPRASVTPTPDVSPWTAEQRLKAVQDLVRQLSTGKGFSAAKDVNNAT